MRITIPVTAFGRSDWPIEFSGLTVAQPRQLNNPERSIRELLADKGPVGGEARVELHRRFAFPIACFAFCAGGRSAGRAASTRRPRGGALLAVISSPLIICCPSWGRGLQRQGALTPAAGIWIANAVLFALGLALMPRMEQFRGETLWLPADDLFGIQKAAITPPENASPRQSRHGKRGEWRARKTGNAREVQRKFPAIDRHVRIAAFFLLFCLADGRVCLSLRPSRSSSYSTTLRAHRVSLSDRSRLFLYLAPYLLYQLAPLGALSPYW